MILGQRRYLQVLATLRGTGTQMRLTPVLSDADLLVLGQAHVPHRYILESRIYLFPPSIRMVSSVAVERLHAVQLEVDVRFVIELERFL